MSERTTERDSTTEREDGVDREADDGTSNEERVEAAGSDRFDVDLSALDPRSTAGETGADAGLAAGTTTDADATAETDAASAEDAAAGERSSVLPGRLAGAVSLRSFLVALALTTGAGVALGTALPFERLGTLLGVFLASGVVGLVGRRRRYLEVTAAGALTAGIAMLLGSVLASVLSLGAPAAFGVGAGALVAFLGHYAGRDLRAGFEREL